MHDRAAGQVDALSGDLAAPGRGDERGQLGYVVDRGDATDQDLGDALGDGQRAEALVVVSVRPAAGEDMSREGTMLGRAARR